MDWYQIFTGRPSPGRRAPTRTSRYLENPEGGDRGVAVVPRVNAEEQAGQRWRQGRPRPTDLFLAAVFGRQNVAGQSSTSTTGTILGASVGNRLEQARNARERAPDFPFPMDPGGSPPMDDLSPAEQAQYADRRRQLGEYGAASGRLAREADMRPRLPAAAAASTEISPSNPAFFMGPSGRELADRAAYASGAPVPYMEALTGHESGDDPDAEAPTSSATGLGQFIDDTWLRMMNQYGGRYGFGEGRLANLSREDVLNLRRDPMWARLMTAEYARENAPIIRRAIGRQPTEGEVYIGHWLGPETAAALIKAVDQDRRREGRGRTARSVVSNAAFQANMPIFYTPDADVRLEGSGSNRRFVYHGGGRLRTVAEVYAAQTRAFRRNEFVAEDYPANED